MIFFSYLEEVTLELRHLRYFVAVAEEEHMTRAAQRLGIQQPPLSQQIRDLETELGVELFERAPRRIKLNTAGAVFLVKARQLLAQADEAVLHVRKSARGELGHIAVGYTSSAAMHEAVPALLKAFGTHYPLITLSVTENNTRTLLEAVREQKLDAVFVRSTVTRYPSLLSVLLDEEPMVAAFPADHPMASVAGPMSMDMLSDQPFILYRQADGPGVQDRLLAACRSAGFELNVTEEVPRLLSAVTLVAAGKGVSLLPQTLKCILNRDVVYRPLAGEHAFTTPLTLAYRETPSDSPLGRLVSLARERGLKPC